MRTCRARSVHLLGGSTLTSLSSTRRARYILPWLFSIRCLGPASSREPVFPSYRGTATDSGATRSRDYPMWTAPPPGTRVPWIWELLGLPRSGGASHAYGHDNRTGPFLERERCGVEALPFPGRV